MSDDEEVLYVKKQRTINYGSLEESEKARLAAVEAAGEDDVEEPSAVSQAQIHTSNGISQLPSLILC